MHLLSVWIDRIFCVQVIKNAKILHLNEINASADDSMSSLLKTLNCESGRKVEIKSTALFRNGAAICLLLF